MAWTRPGASSRRQVRDWLLGRFVTASAAVFSMRMSWRSALFLADRNCVFARESETGVSSCLTIFSKLTSLPLHEATSKSTVNISFCLNNVVFLDYHDELKAPSNEIYNKSTHGTYRSLSSFAWLLLAPKSAKFREILRKFEFIYSSSMS